ncbi:cyanophycin synthetase [Rhizomonospora bruguierae]|uniref:cyanophycin synthetase n=1 Tax=Rhizomonospora bruguierae TaxID=1581705 RepID=UPI001BCB4061|nr:cyanophycin synthetase [Micromonospora sp. NBRC 107566]
MRVVDTRALRGPNVYLSRPVLVAEVHLDDLANATTGDHPGFAGRLLDALPGLAAHHCAAGVPGGFVARLDEGTYFGHVAEHVTIELSQLMGREVNFGRTEEAGEPGRYRVIVECPVDEPPESEVPGRLLDLAIDVVARVIGGAEPGFAAALAELRDRYARDAPGPSTQSIIDAARRRGIPVERTGPLSLLHLGHGSRRRLVWSAMTDRTSVIGVEIAQDKELTRQVLTEAGLPVTSGGAATSLADALALFARLGSPVVLKPRDGRQGQHVYLDLDAAEAVADAFAAAGGDVVIERQVPGRDYRVLVVGGRPIAATERLPAHVVGDGRTPVAGLVERENADPRRGDGHANVLTRLSLDGPAVELLAQQGCAPESVPGAGQTIWLRRNANLSTGGTAADVTDRMHPEVAHLCGRAASVVGLDIAGVDLRLLDIAEPPPDTGADGGIIEVNAGPGLRMHLAPSDGPARPVGEAIVDSLFPGGGDGRVPTVAVTGTNGKTTVARLTAHLLAGSGLRVGLTTTEGVSIDGRLVQRGDATGPASARVVLTDPTVEAAVLETARGGILRRGLGYDWTDAGVITNITGDHLGQDGLDRVEDVADVKALVAERVRDGGTLVLNADDPLVRGLVDRAAVGAARKRLVWFGLDPRAPLIRQHLGRGGTAYLVDDNHLIEATGDDRVSLLSALDVPGSWGVPAGYAAANALAAIAAARALGLPREAVPERLASFTTGDNPGRGMLFRHRDRHVFVDYAHNPAAIAAVTATLHGLWGAEHCLAAVTLPGDRRDDVVTDAARVLADGFGRVVCYEDADARGRDRGEMAGLLERTLTDRRPGIRCERAADGADALDKALAMAEAGEVILLLYEKVDHVLSLLDSLRATPVAAPALAGTGRG